MYDDGRQLVNSISGVTFVIGTGRGMTTDANASP